VKLGCYVKLRTGVPSTLAIVKLGRQFFNFFNHDFIRVAVATPVVRVADPAFNAAQTVGLLEQAASDHATIVLFPELGLSAYSCEDLFHQRALLDACHQALQSVVDASKRYHCITVVGAPLRIQHLLFNCAVVIRGGRILGVVPKTYLPNYREFYEVRQFAPADAAGTNRVALCGQSGIPFGNNLLFRSEQYPLLTIYVEICEDLWAPIPPSSYAAMAGATVLLNLSASNVTISKADYRRQLVVGQSGRCIAAYLFSAAGYGESTTDLAWDGQAMIAENGNLLAESRRFSTQPQLISSEIDLERLSQERSRQTTFVQNVIREKPRLETYTSVPYSLEIPAEDVLLLRRPVERFPYVPSEPAGREERCAEVYRIQVQGLAKRLQSSGIKRPVIGISGGLDSTQALLVTAQAMDLLGLPRTNILGCTMPGFATSKRTLDQAHRLMRAIGCEVQEIDIRPGCRQMLEDIGHPFSRGEKLYDVTFENVQAGERTSHLFRLANLHNGLVVGTGDLSELALGWSTYGVGDHMSHYNVNASVPKTLMAHVVRWIAHTKQLGEHASATLLDILATKISPELVPGGDEGEEPHQHTEEAIGPYDLQDFNLYCTLRFGYGPAKTAFLAYCAWHDATAGSWPDIPAKDHRAYDIGHIKKNLGIFVQRFFKFSQFKRSCIPNAPKVGSGGSLSPRGDYRAPSDSEVAPWLAQLQLIPDRNPD
jgi:NAD+ synthase (glutamine-hydrolysing)